LVAGEIPSRVRKSLSDGSRRYLQIKNELILHALFLVQGTFLRVIKKKQ
jgi:hypothetical protein